MDRQMSQKPLRMEEDEDEEEDGNTEAAVSEREMQCGVGGWRPGWLQPCANIKMFTVTLSLWSLFGSVNYTYYSSVITQIERQFGLPSSVMGFIKNVDNIGYMATVLIFSHFCRFANKPRLFAIATLVSSFAIFLFAVPYFIYGAESMADLPPLNMSYSSNQTSKYSVEYCDGVDDSVEDQEKFCRKTTSHLRPFNTGAFAIFIISELIQGMAQSPKFALSMTYVDDNAKDNSPKYFSFMFAMRAFSPVLGYVLGAWMSSIYVNLSNPDISPTDPRWVGAWWLGFVICAICSVVWALPMLCFPPVLRGGDTEKVVNTKESEDIMQKAKDLPKAIGRLLRNKLYMILTLAFAFEVYLMGYFTFMPKYLQQQFGMSASMASIATGATGALSYAIGPIISGQIVSRKKKFTPHFAMKIIVVLTGLTTVGYAVLMFLGCESDKWAGKLDVEHPDLRLPCNGNCSCDSNTFMPICGESVNYYSPCHAGCTGLYKSEGETIYTGCSCTESGTAKAGLCPKQCSTLIPFIIVMFLSTFMSSMDVIPTFAILMRCVHPKDKAISLAAISAFLQVMAFPAPIVFGLVVDSTCLVLQGCASSRKGACLVYDNDAFRWRMHLFTVGVKGAAFLIYLVGLFISKDVSYYERDAEDEDEDKEMKEMEKDYSVESVKEKMTL